MSLWEIFRGWFNSLVQALSDWANPGQKEAREGIDAKVQAQDAVHEAHEAANEATEARVDASEVQIGKDQAEVIKRQAEREQAKEQIVLDDSVIQAAHSFDDLFPPRKESK